MKSVITGIAIFLGVILMFVILGGFYPENSKGYKDTHAQSQKLIEKQKEYILSKKSQINIATSCPNKRKSDKSDNNSILRQTLKNEYKAKAIEVENDNRALNAANKKLMHAKEQLIHKNNELQKLKSQLLILKKDFKSTKAKTQKELSKVDELNQNYLQQKEKYEKSHKAVLDAQKKIKELEDELRMKDDRLQMLKAELTSLKRELKSLQSVKKEQPSKPIKVAKVEETKPSIGEKKVIKEEKKIEKTIIEIDKKIQKILALRKVEFKSGSAELTKKSKKILLSVADIIKENKNFHYLIEGHTDSSGNEKFNLILSDKRAKTVKAYLIELGVNQNILTAKGFGSGEPIADNSTKEGRIKNRRVIIKIEK